MEAQLESQLEDKHSMVHVIYEDGAFRFFLLFLLFFQIAWVRFERPSAGSFCCMNLL